MHTPTSAPPAVLSQARPAIAAIVASLLIALLALAPFRAQSIGQDAALGFDRDLVLRAVDLMSQEGASGTIVTVRPNWRVPAALLPGGRASVGLVDDIGRTIAGTAGPLAGELRLSLPPELPDGTYRVVIGITIGDTLALPDRDPVVGRIEVR